MPTNPIKFIFLLGIRDIITCCLYKKKEEGFKNISIGKLQCCVIWKGVI